jgi:hypothetical protein
LHTVPVAGTEAAGELAGIERDYPAWHVWRSQAGRWWATRLGHLRPPDDLGADYAMTLDADTAGELRAALSAQSRSGSAPT